MQVLARSLFSPRTSGATSSSSSGELSPGLGIINCFSPVSRFSCRSLQARRPSCGEGFNSGWLESGTQGFKVNFSREKNITLENDAIITSKDNREIKTITESSVDSPDQQINVSHSHGGVLPAQTSTPTQSKPAQSKASSGFIEPIPRAQGIKNYNRVFETDSFLDTSERDKLPEKVMYSDDFKDNTSDVAEYSYESAEDPFSIICSPVSKIKEKKENISCSKGTAGKSNQKTEENIVLSNLVDEDRKKIKQKCSPGNALGSSFSKNWHPEIDDGIEYNKFRGKSSCTDNFFVNNGKSNIAEDTKCKFDSPETMPCQATKGLSTKSNCNIVSSVSENHIPALFAKTVTRNWVENTNKDNKDHVLGSFDSKKNTFSAQFSGQQKRRNLNTLSQNKKERLLKSFVYPADLGEGYEELNISYTETITSDNGGDKAETSGRKEGTCSTSTKGFDETRNNEASMLFVREATLNTPTNRLSDEERIEVDNKRVACLSSTTPLKAKEELDMITIKQKKFLPLTNLSDMDIFETSLRLSFDPQEAVSYGPERTCLESKGTSLGKKENAGSNRTHQAVPVTSYGKDCIMGVTSEINVKSNLLTETINKKYNSTPKNAKMSALTTASDLASVAQSVFEENQEAQIDIPHINVAENLTAQESEEQRKNVISSALNNHLVSDTYSDIDFSDSDLDISIPVIEESVTNDKNIREKKESTQFSNIALQEKCMGDMFNQSHSDKSSGFNGFMTGSGKQVKVSEKALLQAKKLLEELDEERSLSSQQASPGGSIIINYSIKDEKKGTNHLTGIHNTSNSNHCTKLETGSLNMASNLSKASNSGVSEALVELYKGNISNSSEVKNGNREEVFQVTAVKKTSNVGVSYTTENDTVTEAEGKVGNDALGREQLHCEERSMCIEEVQLPEITETINKSAESESKIVKNFCTAAGSKVNGNKETIWEAQLPWQEVDLKVKTSLNKNADISSEVNILGNKRTGKFKKSAISTELSKERHEVNGTERNELNNPNNKTYSALDMEVGFHTARGKKVSINKTSIAQAHLMWKEAASCDAIVSGNARTQGQLNTSNIDKNFVEVDEGFHTAKGNKISVNESSLRQADSLWKETVSCGVEALDLEGSIEQPSISNDIEHNGKARSKFDGQLLKCSKLSPILTNHLDHDLLSKKVPDKESTEPQEFTKTTNRVNLSHTSRKIKEKRNVCDKVSRKLFSRPAGMSSATYIGPSIASGVNITRDENLPIKPRRLFQDDKHFLSGSECMSPKLFTQNMNDSKSDENFCLPHENVDSIERSFMKGSENNDNGSKTSDVMKQDRAYDLSVEEERSTLERPLVEQETAAFRGFLTGSKRQVKVSSESLQAAKQLLQACTSNEGNPEKIIKPSCEIEKSCNSNDDKQITTVESSMSVTDHNTDVDETHKFIHWSPILGSQKRSKGKVKRSSYVTSCQEILSDSLNSHEILDISDVTEAFLKDHLLDYEEMAKGCISNRKRSLGQCQVEEASLTSKKMRRNAVINHHENMKGKSHSISFKN